MPPFNRRRLLRTAALSAPFVITGRRLFGAEEGPANRLRVAVMGLGRGIAHIRGWQEVPNCDVVAVCDTDKRRLAEGAKAVAEKGAAPVLEGDIRKLLERKDIDVLSIAAPNFWHAPAAILACTAGKHVYVEKPGSHNAREGELMVGAAQKYGRKVQQGTQRRSLPALKEAVDRLRAGEIGKVTAVRCSYTADRKGIGKGRPVSVPDWLDWDLWQGPAPERGYRDNLVHYNWHWLWHYGGGELANNGVHALDLAMWGLGSPLPRRVTCGGGRYQFTDDDQETPDTAFVSIDFGHCAVHFDGSSRHQRKADPVAFVTFYGEGGSLAMSSSGYRIHDPAGKELAKNEPAFTDIPHFLNLADAIRRDAPLNCGIAEGQKSTLLCHLGNIACRTTGSVGYDPDKHVLVGSPEQTALWSREYRAGWQPVV